MSAMLKKARETWVTPFLAGLAGGALLFVNTHSF
jgi:hypothetical protein